MSRIFSLAAVVLLAVAVTGCGIDADASASASPKNKRNTAATSVVSEASPAEMEKSIEENVSING